MNLLDLNDDVLRSIFCLFYGLKAKALSLTCRRIHRLAVPRIAAEIHCDSLRQLQRIHRFLLPDPPAQRPVIFVERLFYLLESESDGHEEHAALILDILRAAQNLVVLDLADLTSLVVKAPQIASAVSHLRRLKILALRDIDDEVLASLHSLKSAQTLSRLVLSRDPNRTVTLPGLCAFLSTFPSLKSLQLIDFDIEPCDARFTMPSYPSIESVDLRDCWLPALPVVDLCPRAKFVGLYFLEQESIDWQPEPLERRWPSLHALSVDHGPLEGLVALARMRTADFLQLKSEHDAELRVSTLHTRVRNGLSAQDYCALFRAAAPIGAAFLLIIEDVEGPCPLLTAIAASAPRLRFVHLRLSLRHYLGDPTWPRDVAALLAPFALTCLCVEVKEKIPRGERDAFLTELALGMPSLRFVAYGLPEPTLSYGSERPDPSEDELYGRAEMARTAEPDDCAGLREYDLEACAVDLQGAWLWWRVVRGDEGVVSLERMEGECGARLWRFLRRATVEEIDGMRDEAF